MPQAITDFTIIAEWVEDLDSAYELSEAISNETNYGNFSVKRLPNGNLLVKNTGTGEEGILTQRSEAALQKLLENRYSQDGLDISSYKNYMDMCNKDD